MALWSGELRSRVVRLVGDQIWTYLHGNAHHSEHRSLLAGLTRLPLSELERLLDQRLLQHQRVRRYVSETAPLLLRGMSKTATCEEDQGLGAIRGRIDWPRTSRGRMTLGGPEAPFFAWRAVQRQYDLPENRLAKNIPRRLSEICASAASGAEPISATQNLWRNQAA